MGYSQLDQCGETQENRKRSLSSFGLENLESRDLLAGDVVAGGVLGLRSDIDQSDTVDFADFLLLSSTYEQKNLPDVNGDINADGSVSFHDFTILSQNFGASTDVPTSRVQILHNSPYATAAEVDVYLDGGLLKPLDNFSFRSATPYMDVAAGVGVQIDITAPDAEDHSTPVFSATVVLEEGKAASGFLAPPAEADRSFGLLAIFPNRDTALLPAAATEPVGARLQVVHNSPYAASTSVDVYVNGGLLSELDELDFRKATPFLTVPAGVEITLDVTAANAADNSDVRTHSYTAQIRPSTPRAGPIHRPIDVAVLRGVPRSTG